LVKPVGQLSRFASRPIKNVLNGSLQGELIFPSPLRERVRVRVEPPMKHSPVFFSYQGSEKNRVGLR
jgi:hypothetical protein